MEAEGTSRFQDSQGAKQRSKKKLKKTPPTTQSSVAAPSRFEVPPPIRHHILSADTLAK